MIKTWGVSVTRDLAVLRCSAAVDISPTYFPKAVVLLAQYVASTQGQKQAEASPVTSYVLGLGERPWSAG